MNPSQGRGGLVVVVTEHPPQSLEELELTEGPEDSQAEDDSSYQGSSTFRANGKETKDKTDFSRSRRSNIPDTPRSVFDVLFAVEFFNRLRNAGVLPVVPAN